jgi:Excreted virulence factor EspC, type VII ESX diderm
VADRLQADLAGLSELSKNLGSIATKIDGTQNAFVQASFDLGSVAIEAELENFERTWDVGRKRIHDDIDSLGTMLSDSVKTYAQTDDNLAAALKPDDTATPESHGRAAV